MFIMSSCSKIDDGGQGNTGGEFENSSIELGAGVEQEIILESDGGSKIIRFTAPQNWHVELAGESDWLVLSPVEGDAGTGRGLVSGSRRNEVPKGGWSEAELWRSLPTTLCLPIERKKPTLLGRLILVLEHQSDCVWHTVIRQLQATYAGLLVGCPDLTLLSLDSVHENG